MIKEIKQVNKPTKWGRFWVQSITILSVLVVLQAYHCSKGPIMPNNLTDVTIARTDLENFKKQTKHLDFSETFQNKAGKPKRSYLYASIRAEDSEKLQYIVSSIDRDIKDNKCRNPDILNVTDELSGKTPLARAIETDNPKIVSILLSSPNINLTAVDKEQRNPLHMAAAYNKGKAFKEVWKATKENYQEKAIEYLFATDKKGYSVFASAYLPDPGFLGSNASFNMFKAILDITKDLLKESDFQKIISEIMDLQHKETISKKYAGKLQNEINLIKHPKPSAQSSTKKEKSE